MALLTRKIPPKQASAGYVHISAYRVLFLLKQLITHQALSYTRVSHMMAEDPLIGRVFGAETITKYMNTLRTFGCDIPKANGRQQFQYQLLNAPFPIILDDEYIEALLAINRALSAYPDEQLQVQFLLFFEHVLWSGQVSPVYANKPLSALMEDTNPSSLESQESTYVRKFQQWCRERQALMIHYDHSLSDLQVYYLDLLEVTQEDGSAYILGYDRELMQQVRLDVHSIRQVRQLPCKVQNRLKWVNVQFQLTGRLARTYRLYPGESLVSQSEDESGTVRRMLVRAKTLEPDTLLTRLFKYGPWCEVLSPQYMRRQAKGRLDQLLQAHDQHPLLNSEAAIELGNGPLNQMDGTLNR